MLSENSSSGKLWAVPLVLPGQSRARALVAQTCGAAGMWGLCRGAGGVPVLGPAAEAGRRRDGRRHVGGELKGRTGLAQGTAARLFLALHAHRVSSCFQAVLLARFVWFALPAPLPCKCHKDETVVGEQPLWKDVWRRDLNVRATRESRSGGSLCAKRQ